MLDRYRVVKAVIFTITWTFDGPVDRPDRADVRSTVNAHGDLRCRNLRSVLNANGLTGAFRNPPPSELSPSANHAAELQDLLALVAVRIPDLRTAPVIPRVPSRIEAGKSCGMERVLSSRDSNEAVASWL
jgi:hypothetical protein